MNYFTVILYVFNIAIVKGNFCENANCSQLCKLSREGADCYCQSGYKLDNDKKSCIDLNECEEDGYCSQRCKNAPGTYECMCLEGYELRDRLCRAKGMEPLLLFTTVHEIRGLYLRTGRTVLIREAVFVLSSFDFDLLSSRIYWSEISNQSKVYSSKIDGTERAVVFDYGRLVPENVAVDNVARNIYLTDSGLKQILVCKLDEVMCHVLHKTKIQLPLSIALDVGNGYLYWSDRGDKTVGIYRSGMDGSQRKHLVSTDVGQPRSIVIDYTINRLFWADSALHKLECITLDGRMRKAVLHDPSYHPFSLSVFEDDLYWSDQIAFSIFSCNKFTGRDIRLIAAQKEGIHVMGIHVYHPVLARIGENSCWSNPCSHMCVLAQHGKYKCVCPPGFFLGVDQKTCTLENSPRLFVSTKSRIFHILAESEGAIILSELPIGQLEEIASIAFSVKSKCLFIGEVKDHAIIAINMTILSRRYLVENDVVVPSSLSYDWLSNNLYWTDSSKGTVEVFSLTNSRRAVLIEGLSKPTAIVVAPSRGFMFVSVVGNSGSTVSMYNMDGQNRRILQQVRGELSSLALHPVSHRLYWADPKAEAVSYIDYLDSESIAVFKRDIGNVTSIAVSDKYFYWTNMESRKLHILQVTGLMHTVSLPDNNDGMKKVIYVAGHEKHVNEYKVKTSICSVNNGGCSHVCISMLAGRSCACPFRHFLYNETTCVEEPECSPEEFSCVKTLQCIPNQLYCDGSEDCGDGSDEDCSELFIQCPDNDFQCRNRRCVLQAWVCNNKDDCGDNSDEENCPNPGCAEDEFQCGNEICIALLWRCDGDTDCDDGSDERNCQETVCDELQFRCNSGKCIPISWLCDETNDCPDGEDEQQNCYINIKRCDANQFRCHDGACISEKMVCNGRNDCKDGSDEQTCVHKPMCSPDEFSCVKTLQCIPEHFYCDGNRDCSDGSDEDCNEYQCPENEFQCGNRRCINQKLVCNSRDNCGDNSDEEDCGKTTSCSLDQFSCANGQCIPLLWRCDGHGDCNDTSDELKCQETVCTEQQFRCNYGQCIPISWLCDGAADCYEGTDEVNCGNLCNEGMFRCNNGTCIYNNKICDGQDDCDHGEDEINCTRSECHDDMFFCSFIKRCIFGHWKCDGYDDCGDGADEASSICFGQNSGDFLIHADCKEFLCNSGQCLQWSKVCDGHPDCTDSSDEGNLCGTSCSIDNGGCLQVCRKSPRGPQCGCIDGYRLLSDGITCEDINECEISGHCSQFCKNTRGGYKCSCARGYHLEHDRRKCKAGGRSASLLYLLRNQVRGVELSSRNHKIYVNNKAADMKGMDYDASEGIYFWSERKGGGKEDSINMYAPDSNHRDILMTSSGPTHIKWDWIAKNLYYTDKDSSIRVCSKDGIYCATIVYSAAHNVASFDISPKTGLMFWSVWRKYSKKGSVIERAEMDGANRKILIQSDIEWPSAITVDNILNLLYWTDAKLDVIERTDFQGANRKRLKPKHMYYPLSMALFEDYVFWADWGTDKIIRCDRFSAESCVDFLKGNARAEVITVVHEVQQPKEVNRCAQSDCTQLCLLKEAGFTCKCDDSFTFRNSACVIHNDAEIITSTPFDDSCPGGESNCNHRGPCVVVGGVNYCQCRYPFMGNKCELRVPGTEPPYDFSWMVFVMIGVLIIGIITLTAMLCSIHCCKPVTFMDMVSSNCQCIRFSQSFSSEMHLNCIPRTVRFVPAKPAENTGGKI